MSRMQRESGAVSLFIVIFTALLVTVITIGFSQLILRNQQQASQADLSQSAYDSALAGVEDAKRALVLEKQCEAKGGVVPGVQCTQLETALASQDCNTLNDIFAPGESGERLIQKTEGDGSAAFDQATTCVKISQNTPDFQGRDLTSAYSQLVPLRVAPGQSFNKVELSWFTQDDVSSEGDSPPILSVPLVDPTLLPNDQSAWRNNTPPLLRAQLIQFGDTFNLSDFDDTVSRKSDSNTLFLYPSNVSDTSNFSLDNRRSGTGTAPQQVTCNAAIFARHGYACTVTIDLPLPKQAASASDRTAYLRLSALYNTTRYKIVLKNGTTNVDFYGVQPEVDSTGRTNNLFRRVKARVQLESSSFPYPEQAVYLYGDLCKQFFVTNKPGDFKKPCNLDIE